MLAAATNKPQQLTCSATTNGQAVDFWAGKLGLRGTIIYRGIPENPSAESGHSCITNRGGVARRSCCTRSNPRIAHHAQTDQTGQTIKKWTLRLKLDVVRTKKIITRTTVRKTQGVKIPETIVPDERQRRDTVGRGSGKIGADGSE